MSVLTDIKIRGVRDVFFLVFDGLKGLFDVVSNVWPLSTVQTCITYLIRNTVRLASKNDWDALKRDVRPIYTSVNLTPARAALKDFTEKLGKVYSGGHGKGWERNESGFFLSGSPGQNKI